MAERLQPTLRDVIGSHIVPDNEPYTPDVSDVRAEYVIARRLAPYYSDARETEDKKHGDEFDRWFVQSQEEAFVVGYTKRGTELGDSARRMIEKELREKIAQEIEADAWGFAENGPEYYDSTQHYAAQIVREGGK